VADDTSKDEKTEDATQHKLDEARKKGQVAFSTEFSTGVGMVAATLAMLAVGSRLADVTGEYLRLGLVDIGSNASASLEATDIAESVRAAASYLMPTVLMFLAPMVILTAIGGYSQVGFQISQEAIEPDPNKLNPVKGIKKVISMKGVVRTAMAIAKIAVLLSAMLGVIYTQRERFAQLAGADLRMVLMVMGEILGRATLMCVVILALLSTLDLVYQKHQHKTDMKMTKQEVKEEAKSADGDPKVKARIRQIQREMAGRRMMADVPDATVVLTNPTHYAVALRYHEDGLGGAPLVLAKGVDEVAQMIKKVAREANVMVVEDPPLARALHRSCEIGDEIPAELFGAVAKVLAYVFRMNGRMAQA
jgi:flagellar biosynthetic protein FlhB